MRISDWSSDVCSSDLALVRLRLAPATDLSSDLPDLLLVIAGDLDRRVIRGLDLDPFGDRKVDIMAVAKLQLQITTLSIRTIADASDFQNLGEAFGHASNQEIGRASCRERVCPYV